jgi:UDP-3-O-[3-hydroxymyristoyl] N-acetylglucosamine deacetylase
MQHTLAQPITCDGISLHQGAHVRMTLHPAPEHFGIWFKRTDIAHAEHALIKADVRHVTDTRLCTVLENAHGVRVSTVEHVMAALWGSGIDNVLIEIDGAEVPVMDGSSEPFMFLIECAGVVAQDAPRTMLRVLKSITVHEGGSSATIAPCEDGFMLDVDIAFAHHAIGVQRYSFDATETTFKQSLARARTFGFFHEVEAMRAAGLARGGSLHNAVVINEQGIMNQDGLRFHDECVRHKALDCIGDYFLTGVRFLAHVTTSRPGHSINNALMRALLAQPDAWMLVREHDAVVPAHVVSAVQSLGASVLL